MTHIDHRPANGGGSCARCQAELDLASTKVGGLWYCSSACAEGRTATDSKFHVPEPRLYNRPRRFFRKRTPKELIASRSDD